MLIAVVLVFVGVRMFSGSVALPVGPGTDPYGELLTRIERLEQRDRQQSEHIAALESNMAAMAAVITDQQRELNHLRSQAFVGKDVPLSEAEHDDILHDTGSDIPKATYSDTEEGMDVPMSAIRAFGKPESYRKVPRAVSDGKVAFFATLSKNLLHLGVNQNIAFEGSLVNVGNAYNPHHGVFTAPVSGTYLFSVSILASNNREVWTHLALNGHVVSHIYARGTDNRHDQGSQTVILNLRQGNDVTVQNEANDDAIFGDGYSSFIGLLLWPTQSEAVIVG